MERALFESIFKSSSDLKSKLGKDPAFLDSLGKIGLKMREVAKAGGVIYACGNGGSACDAMHLVEELVARFKRERPGIRAMHFLDAGTLSCWSNDYDFSGAFERQAETFCTDKDMLFAFSTSGNSENVLRASIAARKKGCFCVGLSGKDGGKLKTETDLCVVVPASETERIQEVHITIVHALLEYIEK